MCNTLSRLQSATLRLKVPPCMAQRNATLTTPQVLQYYQGSCCTLQSRNCSSTGRGRWGGSSGE